MGKRYFSCLLALIPVFCYGEYKFHGEHYIANYTECDKQALRDVNDLLETVNMALDASGVTVLSNAFHMFEPEGVTVVYLLSESHASIHTYPEHNACFIDIFTCGPNTDIELFDKILRAYLLPKKVSSEVFIRNEKIKTKKKSKNIRQYNEIHPYFDISDYDFMSFPPTC
jgi:S-adenosylmethionine decarboxylase